MCFFSSKPLKSHHRFCSKSFSGYFFFLTGCVLVKEHMLLRQSCAPSNQTFCVKISQFEMSFPKGSSYLPHVPFKYTVYYDKMRIPRGLSGKESTYRCRRQGFDPWVGKIPWRRKWQPTPYSCPGNCMDRGAWGAIVYGVEKSQTQLSPHTHTHTHTHE